MVRPVAVSLLLMLFASTAGATGRELIVIDSNVSRLQPGSVVEATEPLTLAQGERLTLVGDNGAVFRLDGPVSGPPAINEASGAGDDGVLQALSRLFSSDVAPATKAAWGGFRGAETPQGRGLHHPGDVWAWNLQRSDSICVPAGIAPSLWRSDASAEQSVVVLHISTGREADVAFAAAQHSALWPRSVPLLDGGEYAVRDASNLWERRLIVRIGPVGEISTIRQIAWMSDAGCLWQARLLVARLQ
jgi:hypothetical protein